MEGEINKNLLVVAENDGNKEESLKKKIWNESKQMWIVAGPAILIRFSSFGVHVISQAFIGRVSASELAAYALVFTVLFRFFLGIVIGMVGGLGTLCGQAYGAKKYDKLGVYLQQSWIILLTVSALSSPLFIFAAPILKALGQDEEISEKAGAIASVFSLLQHIFLSWLLAIKLEFGVNGIMMSTVLAYLIPNVGQLVYVMCGGCRDTWTGFTMSSFVDLGLTIKLSVSSGVMICLEFCYTTILMLLAGNMGNAEVTIDALSICLNISGWALMVSFGFLAAASVRVSNELGRRDAGAAKLAIVVIMVTSFAIALVLFAFFLLFRENAAYMFTESEAVGKAVAGLFGMKLKIFCV